MASPSHKRLQIGVLLEFVQLSDIVGVDIFGNLDKTYVGQVSAELTDITFDAAVFLPHLLDITFHYIAATLEPAHMTPSLSVNPTITYDDCPRDLDIVIVGGTLPSHRPVGADKFMKEAWESTPVWITTCIGSMWLASSGVLAGRKATTNRMALDMARRLHPDVEWLDQRWVVEEKPYSGPDGKGELWTSGGAGAGIEMIATYALEHFNKDFVRALGLSGLEFDPAGSKGQFYVA